MNPFDTGREIDLSEIINIFSALRRERQQDSASDPEILGDNS